MYHQNINLSCENRSTTRICGTWIISHNGDMIWKWFDTMVYHMRLLFGHMIVWIALVNTLRSRQNGRHFADDIFKCVFLNENVWIPVTISLKYAPKGPINNIPALVQIMAWRRSGDKPLSELMMVELLTQICVTRPQWVNTMDTRTKWGILKPTFASMKIFLFSISLKFVLNDSITDVPAL